MVYVRFGFDTLDSVANNFEGWYIDDVDVSGTPASNDAPVAANDIYDMAEDAVLDVGAAGVLANDTDADGDPMTSVLVAGTANGGLTLNADGSFIYTPNADFNGIDSFTYKANDGFADSNTATVSITVNPMNDAPVAANDSYSTNESAASVNAFFNGVLTNDTDVDQDLLNAALVTGPANGTLTLYSNGTFDYVPDPGFSGTDSFSYKANDGTAESNDATVSITVNPVNDAPVAVDDGYSTDEDTVLSTPVPGVLDNDSDADGDPMTSVLVAGTANGALTLNANGSFSYTPNADFNGIDSFTYKANDGLADSNTATVSITVEAVNDAPVAADDSYSTDEDTGVLVTLSATDLEECELTFSIISGPANGTLTALTAQTCVGALPNSDSLEVTYTPNAGFTGTDSFTYKANDGTSDSNDATVSITVNPVNDAPVAVDDGYSVAEDAVLDVDAAGVLANDSDADGNPMTSVLVTDTANGVLTLNADGSFSYTPNADFNGSDSFSYKANDGLAGSNEATVTITVNPMNDAPVAADDSYSTAEDTGGVSYSQRHRPGGVWADLLHHKRAGQWNPNRFDSPDLRWRSSQIRQLRGYLYPQRKLQR